MNRNMMHEVSAPEAKPSVGSSAENSMERLASR